MSERIFEDVPASELLSKDDVAKAKAKADKLSDSQAYVSHGFDVVGVGMELASKANQGNREENNFKDKVSEAADEKALGLAHRTGQPLDQILETEGVNKGRVKDIDLAMAGAEAEDQYRADDKKSWVTFEGGADRAGEEAISRKVRDDAEISALKDGLRADTSDRVSFHKSMIVEDALETLKDERVQEEKSKVELNAEDIIETEGSNKGAIKDQEVASSAAGFEDPAREKAKKGFFYRLGFRKNFSDESLQAQEQGIRARVQNYQTEAPISPAGRDAAAEELVEKVQDLSEQKLSERAVDAEAQKRLSDLESKKK